MQENEHGDASQDPIEVRIAIPDGTQEDLLDLLGYLREAGYNVRPVMSSEKQSDDTVQVGEETDIWQGQNPTTLSLNEAAGLLGRCYRHETPDGEAFWFAREASESDGPIAVGHAHRDGASVLITLPNGGTVEFNDRHARALFMLGIWRGDAKLGNSPRPERSANVGGHSAPTLAGRSIDVVWARCER